MKKFFKKFQKRSKYATLRNVRPLSPNAVKINIEKLREQKGS